jgi:regulator of sigma E protease
VSFSHWNQALPGVLLLGLVIFVHELGHFLMAKWRGVRVLRFSLGFGPKLVGFTRGGTEYWLSWIPLGGYVQMAGDTPDPDGGMPGGRDEFLSHPWFGRVLIAASGPAANLVTAFAMFVLSGLVGETYPDYPSVLGAMPPTSAAYRVGLREGDHVVEAGGKPIRSIWEMLLRDRAVPKVQPLELVVERAGQQQRIVLSPQQREPVFASVNHTPDPPIVGAVSTGMPAYKAGLQEGDRIVAVADRPIHTWDDLPASLHGLVDRPVKLTIERGGRRFDVTVTPMDPEGRGRENGRIGIAPLRRGVHVERYGLFESVGPALRLTGQMVSSVYAGMWLTLSRPLYYREYVGGPLFIMQAAQEQARQGLDYYLRFIALINIAIMAFNLLPLPVLDGGHILLAVLEAVRRQSISARAYLRFQKVGLAVLGTLLVIILANDPLRLVQRHRAIDQQSTPTERPVAPASP